MNKYLKSTQLLDFEHQQFSNLIKEREWDKLTTYERIGAVYHFVQNEIQFGYNEADDLLASTVLNDGYGQCNTKGTLLMALLRKMGIPCRFHGFTIDKRLQKGAIAGLAYYLAPSSIIHSWVEVYYKDQWLNLEGFILDEEYLSRIQKKFETQEGAFCGYAIATNDLQSPAVSWKGGDTYIQKEGINKDFGIYDSPDDFYSKHGANLSGLKKLLFKHVVRKWMNLNISRLRSGEI